MDVPKDITLRQLRALCAVTETGTFRRAAERLGITQPSLSAQIQGLEDAVGCVLIERGRRGALLTPAGREADARARDVLDAVAAFSEAIKRDGGGMLRLGVTPTVGPYLLPKAVAALHASDPDMRLYIREAPPRSLSRELTEGMHDVIVTHLPVTEADLESEELFRERLLLTLPRDHALAAKQTLSREDLAGLEVISLDARYQLHDQVTALCQSFGARFQHGYEGTSLDALRLMTGAGMGVTFLPALYVHSEIRDDSEVVARELEGRTVHRSIGLAWRRNTGRTRQLSRLADLLRETFKQLETV
ncbi:MAG: hydrogen peroxide-inducible genes activator [Pseudomonadota bacterium]